jgi:neutral ceramidase
MTMLLFNQFDCGDKGMFPRAILLTVLTALPICAAFRAAALKVDITPQTPQWLLGYGPRQSTSVHDPIFHRVLAIDDGQTQFYLVSSDICLFSPSLYDEVAANLERTTGIARKQFWWAVTHTHSAPEIGPPDIYKMLLKGRSDHEWDREYTSQVSSSLIRGVQEARAKLEPARLRTGLGISMANINRRAKDVDGRVSLGLNPEGPVDRQIGLIRVERTDGSPIALVANYAIHGTVLSGENKMISGDAPGIVAAYLEQKLGAPVLFVNGAAGNLAPIYSVYPNPNAGHLSEFRVLLGDRILDANAALPKGSDQVALRLDETFVETPLKPGLEWPKELSRYSAVDETGRTIVRLPLRFLRINDTVIWAAPVELFCEVAIQVRSVSPFSETLYFGYTNGWFGYLPTAKAIAEGGYEPATSPFSGSAESDITRKVITFLQGER